MNNHTLAQKLEEALAEKVVAQIDLDKVAKDMAKAIETQLTEDFKNEMSEQYNFGEMIFETILRSPNTKIGKAYNKAIDSIAMKMVGALEDMAAPKA